MKNYRLILLIWTWSNSARQIWWNSGSVRTPELQRQQMKSPQITSPYKGEKADVYQNSQYRHLSYSQKLKLSPCNYSVNAIYIRLVSGWPLYYWSWRAEQLHYQDGFLQQIWDSSDCSLSTKLWHEFKMLLLKCSMDILLWLFSYNTYYPVFTYILKFPSLSQ